MHKDSPHFEGQFPALGKTIESIEVVDAFLLWSNILYKLKILSVESYKCYKEDITKEVLNGIYI